MQNLCFIFTSHGVCDVQDCARLVAPRVRRTGIPLSWCMGTHGHDTRMGCGPQSHRLCHAGAQERKQLVASEGIQEEVALVGDPGGQVS